MVGSWLRLRMVSSWLRLGMVGFWLRLGMVSSWLRLWNEEGERKLVQLLNNILDLDLIPTLEGLHKLIGQGGLLFCQWDSVTRAVPRMTVESHSEEVCDNSSILLRASVFCQQVPVFGCVAVVSRFSEGQP